MELVRFSYVTKFDSMSVNRTVGSQDKVTFSNDLLNDKESKRHRAKQGSCSFLGNFRKKFRKSSSGQPVGVNFGSRQPPAAVPVPPQPAPPPRAVDDFGKKDVDYHSSIKSDRDVIKEEDAEEEDALEDHRPVWDKCSFSHC